MSLDNGMEVFRRDARVRIWLAKGWIPGPDLVLTPIFEQLDMDPKAPLNVKPYHFYYFNIIYNIE